MKKANNHQTAKPIQFVFPILLSVMVGVGTGLLVVLLIKSIEWSSHFFFHTLPPAIKTLGPLSIMIVPAIGGLLVGLFCIFLPKEAEGHGVPEVMKSITLKGGRMNPLILIAKLITSTLSIGSGSSVGREGPSVLIGSTFGSNIGKLFRQSQSSTINLVACGAAAGVSAAFNAPIAGMMFSLEVILREFGSKTLSTVVISSVAASIISHIFLGNAPAFLIPLYRMSNSGEIFLFALLGAFSALIAVFFIRSLDWADLFFERMTWPNWSKPAIGGLMIGLIGIWFPDVFGSGLKTIEKALHGDIAFGLLFCLIVVKIIATSLSLGSGASGGTFAPTLLVGASFGGCFGMLLGYIPNLPFEIASPGAYAVVGMASVFASATFAPVTAILLIFELTGDYHMILPIMIAVVIACPITQLLSDDSIDTIKLKHIGIDMQGFKENKLLASMLVKDAMTTDFEIIPSNFSGKDLLDRITRESDKAFFVVNQKKELTGFIHPMQIKAALLESDLSIIVAEDLARPIPDTITENDFLSDAGRIMRDHKLSHLPVVNPIHSNKIEGVLTTHDFFKAYTHLSLKQADLINRLEHEALHSSKVLTMSFIIPAHSHLVDKKLRRLKLPHGIVFSSIERKNDTIVPEGETVLKARDKVWVAIVAQNRHLFDQWLAKNRLTKFALFNQ